MEAVTYFIFLGSKITVDGDHIHEIKRRLLLGRKAMTNLDSILKSRDISLPTKVHIVKAMVFPVVYVPSLFFLFFFRSYPKDQIQAMPDVSKSFPSDAQDGPGGLALGSNPQ